MIECNKLNSKFVPKPGEPYLARSISGSIVLVDKNGNAIALCVNGNSPGDVVGKASNFHLDPLDYNEVVELYNV